MASQRPVSNPPAPAPTMATAAAAAPQPVIIGQQQGIMSQIATTAAGVAAVKTFCLFVARYYLFLKRATLQVA